jgi:hypothetical protein
MLARDLVDPFAPQDSLKIVRRAPEIPSASGERLLLFQFY